MQDKDVTVIIPVFNNSDQLLNAINSVFEQICELNYEIIVVDDCSDIPVSLKFRSEVVLIRHSKNRGPAAARNTAMAHAQGKYIAFLDSDDIWGAGKLEEQVKYMDSSPEDVAGIFAPFYYENLPKKVFNPELERCNWFEYFAMGCRVAPGSTLLFRK